MQVPLLDLKAQYQSIKDECLKVTQDIYESQYFILGPYVEKLEKEIAEYCSAKYAVGVSSGTDALLLSLMAAKIGSGDRVITTPYTFFATAGAVSRVGAIPVFVDIEPDTYNISPAKIDAVIKEMPNAARKTLKAIIPVHLYGQCADMNAVTGIAKDNNLVVIEDAAQAIGSEYQKKRAGSMGDFGCFSFFPSKNLGGFGDGGIVTTNSEDQYDNLKILRVHGGHPKYYHSQIGGNFRLDALQAAIVSIKLKYLDQWTKTRQENAEKYKSLIKEAGLNHTITVPFEKENRHIYNQFIIQVAERRDELKEFLISNNVGCEIYYPVPLHLQECFADRGYSSGDFPVSEYAAEHTLALPVYPELSEEQIVYVVDQIKKFYA
ncbi:MAG: DegT/DnrJ/EryC1/StrS family aminotransferase [Desulfobacteraceae bacterium]|nr:DegT/DnrJ/EryC1/StrS family aminotransferase [Desulfobacteraceae bacterium]MBC2755238.1 DegT/DnrJ/EryC1/StrS family aminotransferase [Desulfobacteraceae bacterium]